MMPHPVPTAPIAAVAPTLALASMLAGAQAAPLDVQTLVCEFSRSCREDGPCEAAMTRMSIETAPAIGSAPRAAIDFADMRGKRRVAYDPDIGLLHWHDSRYRNALMFTPAAPEATWTRIGQVGGSAEVLFGTCRNAF